MRVVVTGISSYLAHTLFPLLEADESVEKIRGLDIKPPPFRSEKLEFFSCDVRDPDIGRHLQGFDAVIHLAYIVMPIRDERKADDININGSKNVFRAAAAAGIKKIIHLSSVAAYGAWPDMPPLITEDVPVRGMPDFYYSRSKAAVELFLDGFEREHPGLVVTRLRPCIFIGPTIENAVKRLIKSRVMTEYIGHKSRLQLVWDADVSAAVLLALHGEFRGAYNLAGDGSLSFRQMGKIMGVPTVPLPVRVARRALRIGFALGMSPINEGWVDVSMYSALMDTTKAKTELGWKPVYDTEGAFRQLLATASR